MMRQAYIIGRSLILLFSFKNLLTLHCKSFRSVKPHYSHPRKCNEKKEMEKNSDCFAKDRDFCRPSSTEKNCLITQQRQGEIH